MKHALIAALRLLAALAATAGLAMPATAGDVPAGDAAAIQSVIQNQIAAFEHDDGAAAYDFASPTIHEIFPSAGAFMDMVRGQYQPVYRPGSVAFGALTDSASGPEQRVYLVGPDGNRWVALYTLERQADGTWKINGCVLLRDNSPTV